MNHYDQIDASLKTRRDALRNHPVYETLGNLAELRVFMEHHVFAVWDFMCLLKALQNRLTCTDSLWRPAANPEACRFVNEIVLCEESDEGRDGSFASHFGLYRNAMQSSGANGQKIDQFLNLLDGGQTPAEALACLGNPESVDRFVTHTLEVVQAGELCEIAACFAFGREDLLPDLFEKIVEEINAGSDGALDDFEYYLNRHIELDGDEHGPMSKRMVESICGLDSSKWKRAGAAAKRALDARLTLWEGMLNQMKELTAVGAGADRFN